MGTFGQLAAELAAERAPLHASHVEAIERQQHRLDEMLSVRHHGAADNGWVSLAMDGRQMLSDVRVTPAALERFSARGFVDAVREALTSATQAWNTWFAAAAQTELGVRPPAPHLLADQVAHARRTTNEAVNALRRHAPTYAAMVEQALRDVDAFQHATFTGSSSRGEITATVNARAELFSLEVDDVPRREVDNHTFAGWLEAALTGALRARSARQIAVSHFDPAR